MFKIKKAFESLKHPGINSSIPSLIKNAVPYYISPAIKVPPPLTVYWSINSVCNLHCKMCDVGTMNEEGTFFKTLRIDRKLYEIDINIFKSVVDEFANINQRPYMAINSTEPLMYKDLPEAIDYCTQNNMESAVTTGAYNLPKRALDLAKARLNRLNVSIDGTSGLHNEIRGRKDAYEKATEGIQIFAQEVKRIGHTAEIFVNCVVTNLNYHGLVDFYNSIEKYPISQINFAFLWYLSPGIVKKHNEKFGDKYKVSESCYDDYVNPEKVDTKILEEQLNQLADKSNVSILGNKGKKWLDSFFLSPNIMLEANASCMASWFFTQILADGKVVVYTRCHNEPIGNINDEPLLKIWNDEKMKGWRKFIHREKKMPMCARCDLVY